MSRLTEIRARLAELKPEIETLGENAEITDDEARSLDEKIAEFDTLTAEAAPLEERAAKVEAVKATVIRSEPSMTAPNVNIKRDAFEVLEDRSMTPAQRKSALVDGLIRSNENKIDGSSAQSNFETVVRRHAGERGWADDLLVRSSDEYASAWSKLVTGRGAFMTDDEKRAAITVATATAGGYLVPTHLDPSIILTNAGTSNAVRAISRVETLGNENVWKGVTSAGVTASWDGEVVEVSDDTSAFVQPTISTYKAQSFIQASIESFEDIDGLASAILVMFADAKDRLEGAAHCTGSGSAPQGIFTALTGGSSVIQSATAAAIAEADLAGIYDGVPVRHRGKAKWLMNPLWDLAIRRLGTAVSYAYSGDLTQGLGQSIYGKEVVLSDDAPEVVTTTALDNRLVYGDFQNYVIVDKPGSFAVEFVPHLFNTSNNLPDGRRGYYAHWRTGADSVNDDAFRMLADKTSA